MRSAWVGEKVRLRAVEPEDWELYWANNEDTEAASLMWRIPPPRSRESAREWARSQAATPTSDELNLAIASLDTDAAIGHMTTNNVDRRNGTFSYGLGLFRPHWGKGCGSDAVKVLLRYFFDELGYAKVNVGVYEFNERSQAMHERLGFVQEGNLRSVVFTAGRRWDEVLYGMTVDEFADRWPPEPR
jgi:RimJ/RimL family protein N-acetyltransferase